MISDFLRSAEEFFFTDFIRIIDKEFFYEAVILTFECELKCARNGLIFANLWCHLELIPWWCSSHPCYRTRMLLLM